MALPVNPQIQPENAPFYLSLSRPIEKPEADKSVALAIAGLGNTVEMGAKSLDFINKTNIDDEVRNRIEAERSGFTGALETATGVPSSQRVGTQPSTDLIPGSVAAPIPAGLQTGLDKAAAMNNAAANGKMPSLMYEANLVNIAKDLRAKYPGYEDYVDEKISSLTGGNPANKYISTLLQTVAQGQSNLRSSTDKALGLLKDVPNMPGVQQLTDRVASGQAGANPYAYVLNATSQWRGVEADFHRRAMERQDNAAQAQTDLVALSKGMLNNAMVQVAGVGGPLSLPSFQNLISGLETGKVPMVNAEDQLKLSNAINNFYTQTFNNIWNKAHESVDGKKSIADLMGDDKVKEQITNALSGIKVLQDQINNKEYGLAHRTAQNLEALTNQTAQDLMTKNDVNTNNFFKLGAALNKIGGPAAAGEFIKDQIANQYMGTTNGISTIVENVKKNLGAQIDPSKTYTLQGAVDRMKQSGIGENNKADNTAYNDLTSFPSRIAKSNKVSDELKANVFRGSFGPGNENLIAMFSPDDVTPDGKLKAGKNTIFRHMTIPAVTDEVYRVGQQYPDVITAYNNFVESNFRQLFGENIRRLETAEGDTTAYKVTYNSDTNKLNIEFPQDSIFSKGALNKNVLPGPRLLVADINSGLDSLAYVAKKQGRDPNASVLQMLMDEGLSATTLGQKIKTAVQTSLTSPTKDNSGGKAPTLEDYPEAKVPVSDTKPLKDIIGMSESNSDYNNVFGLGRNPKRDLSHFTVGELTSVQKHYTDSGSPSSAVGKYQFLRSTINSLIKDGTIKPTDQFTPQLQEKMADALLERRGLSKYLAGKMSAEQFVNNLAKEWAGLPTTSGVSYYTGDGLNKATVKLPEVMRSLLKIKAPRLISAGYDLDRSNG